MVKLSAENKYSIALQDSENDTGLKVLVKCQCAQVQWNLHRMESLLRRSRCPIPD